MCYKVEARFEGVIRFCLTFLARIVHSATLFLSVIPCPIIKAARFDCVVKVVVIRAFCCQALISFWKLAGR